MIHPEILLNFLWFHIEKFYPFFFYKIDQRHYIDTCHLCPFGISFNNIDLL